MLSMSCNPKCQAAQAAVGDVGSTYTVQDEEERGWNACSGFDEGSSRYIQISDGWLIFIDKNQGFLEDFHGFGGFSLVFDLLDQCIQIRIATPEAIETSTPIQI